MISYNLSVERAGPLVEAISPASFDANNGAFYRSVALDYLNMSSHKEGSDIMDFKNPDLELTSTYNSNGNNCSRFVKSPCLTN